MRFIHKLAQISVAVISLTYSIVDGKSWNDTYTRPCVANASKLTCYFDSFNSVGVYGGDITSRALAHAQGEMALCSRCGAYKYISDILKSTHDYGYYCRRTVINRNLHIASTSIILRISRESTRNSRNESSESHLAYASTTPWSAGLKMNGMETCSTSTPMVLSVAISPFQDKLKLLMVPRMSIEVSTPHKRRFKKGSRCIWVWAHKSRGGHGEPSTFYQCPIIVSAVSQALNETFELGKRNLLLALAWARMRR